MKLRIIVMCIMLSLMSIPAFAAGTITGTVTDASSKPLAGISVQLYNSAGNTITKSGTTDSSGNYSITGITATTSGTPYKVIFFGNYSTGTLAQKWYNNATSYSAATPVTVTSTGTNSGINATMGGFAHPKIDLGSVTNAVPGTVVKVPVTLTTDGAAISSPGLTITYDPAKIVNVTSYDPADPNFTPALGAAATAAGKTISDSNPSPGVYTIGLLSTSNTNVVGDGVLVYLYFELAADATGPITLTSAPQAADPSGANVVVTGTSGTITFPDLGIPVVQTFTVPATSTSQVVSPIAFTATDNVGVTGYLINETATTPSLTDSGWKTSPPNQYIFGSEGVKTLYAWAKDAAGNISVSKQASVTITLPDTTPPVVGTFTIPATSTSLTVPVTALSATDNKAVTGYLITESSSAPSATAAGWTSTVPTSYTVTSTIQEGVPTPVTLYAWAKDAAGNRASKPASVTITIADAHAPVVTSFSVAATSTSQTVSVLGVSATDNVGVTGYLVTESSTAPSPTALGWSSSVPTSYTVSGTVAQGVDVTKTLYVWAKDAVGNVSLANSTSSATVTLHLPDTTKPVVASNFSLPATATTAIVNVSNFTATDNVEVTGYLLTESSAAPAATDTRWSATAPTSYTFTGLVQGVATDKTLYAWAKDAAGNVSDSRSGSIKITLNGPSLSFTAATLADGTSTKNPALNIAGTVSGNGTTLQSLTISVNNAAPAALAYDSNGAFNTAIVLVNGANTIAIAATDANNITTTNTRTITLNPDLADLTVTAPITGSFTKESIAQVTGTIGAPQSTTVAITVNGVAVQSVLVDGDNFSATVNLASGLNTIVVTATDSNSGAYTQTVEVTSDGTAPALDVTAPAGPYATPKASVVVSGTVDDTVTSATVAISVDGAAPVTVPVVNKAFSYTVNLPTIKTYAIVVTATDQSGNSSSATRNVVKVYPSGNVTDGVSTPTIVDVQRILSFALGFETPTADQKLFVDVAPLASGKPSPDGVVDGGDALVVLEKVLGKVAW